MPDLTFAIKSQNETGSGLSAVKSDLDDVGESADSSGGKLSGFLGSLGGVAAMAGGVAAVGGAFSFAQSAIGGVEDLAASTRKLQLAIGGTSEDSSRLLFAFKEMGVDPDEASRTIDKFSKSLSGLIENEDGTTTKSSAVTDKLKAMGIATTDASGNALSMNDILGEVADQFQKMPDGPEKTALAMQLFGKSGVDLIPVLDQGSAGMKDLASQSDKLGLTLSGSTVDASYKLGLAQKQLGEAFEGIKTQVGVALIPVLLALAQGATQLATLFAERVVPAIKEAATWLSAQLQPTFLQIQAALPGIIAAVTSFAEALGARLLPIIQSVAQWLEQHRQVAMAVGVALAALVAGPIALLIAGVVLVMQHWQELTGAFNATLPVLSTIGNAFSSLFGSILSEAQPLISWVQTQFLPLFQQDISAVSDFFQQKLIPAIQAVVSFIRDHWTEIESLFKGPLEAVKAIVQATFDTIKNIVELALRVLGDVITAAMDLIHGDFSGAWKAIEDIPRAAWDAIKTQIGIDLTLVEGLLKAAWDSLKADAQLGWDALKAVLADAWTAIKQGVSDGISGLGQLLQALPGQIVGWLGDLSSLLLDAGGKLIGGFVQGIKDKIGDVKDTLGNLTSSLTSWKGPPEKDKTLLYGSGQDVITGFLAGLQSMYPQVQASLGNLTEGVRAVVAAGVGGGLAGMPESAFIGTSSTAGGEGRGIRAGSSSISAAGGLGVQEAPAPETPDNYVLANGQTAGQWRAQHGQGGTAVATHHPSGAGTAASGHAGGAAAGSSGDANSWLEKINSNVYALEGQFIPINGAILTTEKDNNKYLAGIWDASTRTVMVLQQILAALQSSGSLDQNLLRQIDLSLKRGGGLGLTGSGAAAGNAF